MNKSISNSNTYQAMWVGMGSLSSFAFTIISAAVLSRFLSKTEYGTYKQVMYVYNTLLVVFTLGLPKAYAYFLPRYDIKYGNSIVNKLNHIFFLIGFTFTILLYLGSPLIADILHNPKLASSLKLFAIAPTFILPTMGIEGIMSTYKQNYINAIYTLITRLFMLLCVVIPIVIYKADCDTAIIGFSVSSLITCIIGLYLKKTPYKKVISEKVNLSYKDIFRFSVPLMLASLGGIAIKSADQFFVSRYFGTEVFADFANGSIDLPFVGMILGAAATVLLPEFSRKLANGDSSYNSIVDLWRRTAVKSALILFPLIIYCCFFAENIMVFLYGEQYYASAIYFIIMLIVNLFTIAPYYPIIIAFGATNYYAKVHLWMAILVWVLEYLTVILFDIAIAIAVVSALLSIAKVVIMTKFIANRLHVRAFRIFPLKDLSVIIITNILCGAFVFFIYRYIIIDNLPLRLVTSFCLYCIITLLSGKVVNINYISSIQPLFNKFKDDKTKN